MANQYGNPSQLLPDSMDPLSTSTLPYSSDPHYNPYWDMGLLPEIDNPVQPKYQEQPLEPIYQGQILLPNRHDFPDLEFLTPNQPGLGAPNKALPEMNLPPPIVGNQYVTSATTRCAPLPHTPVTPQSLRDPVVAPPALRDLPAARCAATKSASSSASGKVKKPAARTRRTASPTKTSPKDIPTKLGEFEISPELKCDLAGGPVQRGRRKARHTESETDDLIDRLYKEADEHAVRRKMEVRVFLKDELDAVKKDLDSRDRVLLRSRREAKVSRVKNEEFSRALKGIIRYLIMYTDTRRPDPCHCRNKQCGKRPAPSN